MDSNGNSSSQMVGNVVTDNNSAAVTPTSSTFEPTFVGSKSLVHIFTLANSLSNAIALNSWSISGDLYNEFSIYGSNCGSTLAPHHSCLIKIIFKATTSGVDRAELDIGASVPITPVPLWGYATQAMTTPTVPTFADQTAGTTSVPQTVVLKNAQLAPMSIEQIGVTGDFVIDASTTCPTGRKQLAMGDSCNIAVRFSPTTTGPRTGNLTVHGSATVSPYSVSLGGNGAPP